jgi:hypothetical protein
VTAPTGTHAIRRLIEDRFNLAYLPIFQFEKLRDFPCERTDWTARQQDVSRPFHWLSVARVIEENEGQHQPALFIHH